MAIKLSGLVSGMDTDSMVTELVSAYSLKKDNYVKDKEKLEWKQEIWKNLNTKIYSFYTGALSSMRRAASFSNKKLCSISDSTKATVSATNKVPNGTQTVEIKNLAKAAYLTGSKLTTANGNEIKDTTKTSLAELGISEGVLNVQTADKTYQFIVNSAESISDFTARFKSETGVSASFDTNQNQFIFNSNSGTENDFNLTAGSDRDFATLSSMGLATADQYTAAGKEIPTSTAYKQAGEDSLIVVNGATYTSASNSLTVNGLTINATGVSNGVMTISTSQDTDGIYNMVKEFFTGYNTLINSITSDYNADSAKGYEPLTDDEKESMSDTEIEKWETKIKDSLLRRDDTLDEIMNLMTTKMSQGYEVNGKTYYLSSFGINTLGFMNATENEQNAYHIDGDSSDSTSADNTDKLKAFIESDPDTLTSFLNQLTTGLYNGLTEKMKHTSLSSSYTIYNDTQMKDEVKELKSNISDWEDKISDYEEYWYNKFTAMETALSQLQSQTSQLSALLGS